MFTQREKWCLIKESLPHIHSLVNMKTNKSFLYFFPFQLIRKAIQCSKNYKCKDQKKYIAMPESEAVC